MKLSRIALLLIVIMLQACSAAQVLTTVSSRPAGCEKSLIYDHLPAPKIAGGVILIAVSELAHAMPKAKPYLLGAIDSILKVLEDDKVTYVELAQAAAQQVSWVNGYFGGRLLAYSEIISVFDQPIPLYPCDRDLIKAHLKQERVLLSMDASQ